MADRIDENAQVSDATLRLRTLAEAFDLSRRHLDVFLLALAPQLDDFDLRYKRCQQSNQLGSLTLVLVQKLFGYTAAQSIAAGTLLASDSPLLEHDLLTPKPAPDSAVSGRDRRFTVDQRILEYLRGSTGIDPLLDGIATLHFPTTEPDDLRIEDDVAARLDPLAKSDTPTIHYFYGPDGAGKIQAAHALADDRLLEADLETVLEASALNRLRREARILDCPLLLTGVDDATADAFEPDTEAAPDRPDFDAVLSRVAQLDRDCYFTADESWTPAGDTPIDELALVEFPRPGFELRRTLWEDYLAELDVEADAGLLASTFELTQGAIDDAVDSARACGDDPDREAIVQGCKARSAGDLDELAQHIDPRVDRADLKVRERTERKLDRLQSHVATRGQVYDDWGFRAVDGNAGVVALFKGKPGTGKTMAAKAIANEVGMDVYKIDLSTVVSKYIGETEENLERIFQAAEQSNAILLFDEADAVFGDRAEVSDATDRYANVEVNYLLQRIERYDGVILLTTNYASNIDDAFTRRINHIVRFEKPEEETREAIWETIFPDETPAGDVDAAWLAQFEYTGGQIASLGKRIAVEAASDGAEAIRMEHVVGVLERDFREASRMIRSAEFEPYVSLLEKPPQDPSRRVRRK